MNEFEKAKAPKQYTESELRAEFEKGYSNAVHKERLTSGRYLFNFVEADWQAFLRCARFLGAIKEPEK